MKTQIRKTVEKYQHLWEYKGILDWEKLICDLENNYKEVTEK